VRLSASFFMRDFLHSEIADFHGIPNIPDAPDLAIAAGRKLCEQLLEPLQTTFGRLAIRSAYRAPAVNEFGKPSGSTIELTAVDFRRRGVGWIASITSGGGAVKRLCTALSASPI
jgi:hypothetical protein